MAAAEQSYWSEMKQIEVLLKKEGHRLQGMTMYNPFSAACYCLSRALNLPEYNVPTNQSCCVDLSALELVVSSVTRSIETLPVLSQVSFRVSGLHLLLLTVPRHKYSSLTAALQGPVFFLSLVWRLVLL